MVRLVIKDEQWEVIKPFVVSKKSSKGGRPRKVDDRMVVEAVLYITRTGLQWREMPAEFPNWKTVYSRFSYWNKSNTWPKIWSVFKKNWKAHCRNERYFAILQ